MKGVDSDSSESNDSDEFDGSSSSEDLAVDFQKTASEEKMRRSSAKAPKTSIITLLNGDRIRTYAHDPRAVALLENVCSLGGSSSSSSSVGSNNKVISRMQHITLNNSLLPTERVNANNSVSKPSAQQLSMEDMSGGEEDLFDVDEQQLEWESEVQKNTLALLEMMVEEEEEQAIFNGQKYNGKAKNIVPSKKTVPSKAKKIAPVVVSSPAILRTTQRESGKRATAKIVEKQMTKKQKYDARAIPAGVPTEVEPLVLTNTRRQFRTTSK